MASVTVRWNASEATRMREAVETGDAGPRTRELKVDLAELKPKERKAVIEYFGSVDSVNVWSKVDMTRKPTFSEKAKNSGYMDRYGKGPEFDAEPTPSYILDFIKAEMKERAKAGKYKAMEEGRLAKEETWKLARYEELRPQVEALIEAEDVEALAQFKLTILGNWSPKGKDGLNGMIRSAYCDILKRHAEEAKTKWVTEYGSERLKKAFERGHSCQRRYVVERAAMEAEGFTVDFNGKANWKERSCPSEAALSAAEYAETLGLGAVDIVWLTSPAQAHVPSCEEYENWDYWEPREAIVIKSYLGKYDLVCEIG